MDSMKACASVHSRQSLCASVRKPKPGSDCPWAVTNDVISGPPLATTSRQMSSRSRYQRLPRRHVDDARQLAVVSQAGPARILAQALEDCRHLRVSLIGRHVLQRRLVHQEPSCPLRQVLRALVHRDPPCVVAPSSSTLRCGKVTDQSHAPEAAP